MKRRRLSGMQATKNDKRLSGMQATEILKPAKPEFSKSEFFGSEVQE